MGTMVEINLPFEAKKEEEGGSDRHEIKASEKEKDEKGNCQG